MSDIIPEGILYGNLGAGSGTTNYNDLDNKPQINAVTLQGNKTASELGLVGTSDIPVTSVNGETGAVVLDGTDIEYSSGVSVNFQIDTLMNYIPVYGNTASGAIATFDTSLALPLQDCTIDINAVQESGTPTPSSPKLISGFTGANISLGDTTNKVSGSIASASISASGQIVSNSSYTMWYAPITQGKSYIISSNETSLIYGIFSSIPAMGSTAYDTTRVVSSKFTLIAPITGYIAFRSSSTFINVTATENNVTAISWQSEAGTVYGGSLDVTSGVLTVTHGIITFDGSGDEIWNDGTIRYSIEIPDCKRSVGRLEVLCNRGEFASSGGSEGTVFVTNTFFYYYPPTSITSLADFKTWLGSNNLVVVYLLATPVTYQLTPTQISAIVGTNNVFTDTNGNTSVVYACSLKDYIDSQ